MQPRANWRQDLIWRLEAVGFDLVTLVLRLLPIDWVSGLGAVLFRGLGPLTGSHRIAERNIRLAFPELTVEERWRLLRDQWDNLGRTFFEFSINDRLNIRSGRVTLEGGERLAAIAASGEAVVFVSGHFANWEVMPAAIVQSGVPCQVTYRAANNPYVDRRIRESRARYGVRLFAPKGGEGARELLRAVDKGESVALMNDQKFNAGLAVPFFGHLAHTATGPTRLALRAGAPLQFMSVQRVRGARFRVVVHEPIELEQTGDKAADLEAGVARVTAFIEAQVRARPAEWFWVHKRWPKEAYDTLA